MKKKFLFACIMVVVSVLTIGFIVPKGDASAIDVQLTGSLDKKWTFTQLYVCLTDNLNTSLDVKTNGDLVADDIFNGGNALNPGIDDYGDFESTNCTDVLNNALGLYDASLKEIKWNNYSSAERLLDTLGYTLDGSSDRERVMTIKVGYQYRYSQYSLWALPFSGYNDYVYEEPEGLNGYKNGDFMTITTKAVDDKTTNYNATRLSTNSDYRYDRMGGLRADIYDYDGDGNNDFVISVQTSELDAVGFGYACSPWGYNPTIVVPLLGNVDLFMEKLKNELQGKHFEQDCKHIEMIEVEDYERRVYQFSSNMDDILDGTDSARKYVYNDRVTTARAAVAKMANVSGTRDLILTDSERYDLYYRYLDEYLPRGIQDRVTCSPSGSNPDNYLERITLKSSDGDFRTCYINLNGKDPSDTFVTTLISDARQNASQNPGISIGRTTMRQVIDWFNSLTDEQKNSIVNDVAAVDESANPSVDSDDGEEAAGDPCYNSGVEGMSWILCPAVNNMASAIDNFESTVLEWMLDIDSDLYDSENNSGGESATWQAWDTFRSIANVVLIIMFLAVIFSQMTGYGIDNYGIKKILPRLVLMAILLNLSFIICQMAVDISNVVGSGLDNLFRSIGSQVYPGYTGGEFMVDLVAGLFAALAGAASVASLGITIATVLSGGGGGIMLVLILVLALVVALAAVILFFAMVGARSVAIVLLVAISPVAFVCYVLPNTQQLFKQWWKIFKAMLVVYPICGAMHGLSYIIRGIIFGGGEVKFWMAIIAVIAPFIPFFMLPSLLKGTLAALGKVGGTMMAMGNAWRGGIRSGRDSIQNTG